ncbi:MAG: hypothetical protein EA341_14010 [Mongoliibacter sp.]|uniref:hypothetical protein n=1 Tax=Mongoliibacter sp. TaxID=2022438 RepID=UPI0012EF3518|nr:hypothetical protein [Mongoliibacter sp.]TVP46206.1 MAG: hypothetical protein EA341_14010 [Mongoliibacter sp.]
MKNVNLFSLRAMGMVLLSTFLLFSCSQMESFTDGDLNLSKEEVNEGITLDALENGLNGIFSRSFEFSTECLNEEVIVTFDIGQGSINCGNARIDMKGPSDIDWVAKVAEGQPVDGVLTYTFTPTEIGDYQFRGTFNREPLGGGNFCGENINGFTNTFTLNVIECLGCEDNFIAELDCTSEEKTLTVIFTAENSGDYVIQGGLTASTEIIFSEATADFTLNPNHPSAGGPSNVTRWEGSLEECETVTITLKYIGGAGIGSWSAKSTVAGEEVTNGISEAIDC